VACAFSRTCLDISLRVRYRTAQEDKNRYSAADTGFISENVYLFCASEGLATVGRGSIDRAVLAKAMKLRPDQKIILAQTVGYPEK
jgi:nitroreductase